MTARRTVPLLAFVALHFFCAFPAWSGLAQASPRSDAPPPLRDLPKDRPYELRVLYLEDQRLPTLKPGQRSELYSKIERLLDGWYGYHVKLREVGCRNLIDYFSAHEMLFAQQAISIRLIDFEITDSLGPEILRAAIARDFSSRELSQIGRYLHNGTLTSKAEAVETAHRQFMTKLTELRGIPLADGKPFFDATQGRLNSFAHWAVLLEEISEADLVFTNSVILCADVEMPIYVIARGGITGGLTDNNARSPYQAATMVGLFPILSNAPVFLRERGRIPEDELLDVIATFCMHEMGHFFLRYAEHYDHPHCVHCAPTGLNLYEWHRSIREEGPCALEHRKTARF